MLETEHVFTGRREEVGKTLQASFWSQLTLEVGSRERGVARGEPGQTRIATQT